MSAVESPTPALAAQDFVRAGGWYTFGYILTLSLFAFVDRQILSLVAPAMAPELKLSDAQLGMVLGLAPTLFIVICVYPVAWAADRFDRRLILTLCIGIWSAGTVACGLAHNFPELFIATIAVAAGEGGLAPITMSIIPDLFFGRKRVLANSLNYFFAYLGVSIALIIGGFALSALKSIHEALPHALQGFSAWRLTFFMVSIPAPVFIAATFFATLGRGGQSTTLAVAPSAPIVPFVKSHFRAYALVFSAVALYVLAFGCYIAWLPTANTRLFAATGAQNGLGMGISTAVGMFLGVAVGAYMMRRWLVRYGAAVSVRIAWILMAISLPVLFCFPFVAATWQSYALFGSLMVTGTAIGSLVPNMLQGMAPSELRARTFAIYAAVSALLGGSAPTVVGWVSAGLGGQPRQLLLAMAIVAVPCWLLAIFMFRVSEKPLAKLMTEVDWLVSG